MQTKQINIKLMPELNEKIDLIVKMLNIPKVEWVRNVLAYEVRKELEEHKSFIAREYLRGRISKKEMEKILGEKDARDIIFIVEKTKADLKSAKEMAKNLK